MQLQIDGVAVQIWNRVNSCAQQLQFQSYGYRANESISPDRIEVSFINDFFVVGVIDHNLRVDKIVVGGQTFQTEASIVFSTGSWKPTDGIQSGFRESEYLNGVGYFQYTSAAVRPDQISLASSIYTVDETAGSVTVTV